MIKIPIDFDLSGYAYDPDNPTLQAERVNFILYQLLDACKTAGLEIRQPEPADVTDAETEFAALYAASRIVSETSPEFTTPINEDMLLDPAIYESLNKLRAQWLSRAAAKFDEDDESTIMVDIKEILNMMLTQDFILQLADGSKILWRSKVLTI